MYVVKYRRCKLQYIGQTCIENTLRERLDIKNSNNEISVSIYFSSLHEISNMNVTRIQTVVNETLRIEKLEIR